MELVQVILSIAVFLIGVLLIWSQLKIADNTTRMVQLMEEEAAMKRSERMLKGM